MLDQSMPPTRAANPGWPMSWPRSTPDCRRCRRTRRSVCGRPTALRGGSEVPTGPLSGSVGGQPRSAAVNAQTPSGGGAVSFTTLRMIHNDAVANILQGQSNSILVTTAGPHTDQSMDGLGQQQYVRRADRPGPARRNQCHRLRHRPGPRQLGSRRPGGRRRLPEPDLVRVAGAHLGDRHVPGLAESVAVRANRKPESDRAGSCCAAADCPGARRIGE